MNQTSPLENLAGPGKPLHKEPPDRNLGEYEGDLNINERLVADLIAATKRVAEALQKS